MQYSEQHLRKIAKALEPSTCKVFLYLLSLADDGGNIKEQISLNSIHDSLGTAKTTVSRSVKELRAKGVLSVSYEIGIRSYYKLLPESEFRG
ncbi:MAG TPA: helix-turn-helix domain-containing protein [Bacillales bacterium]|nr:helix-turn-helix domain-containing protein [Bacillales bacterium]